MDKESTENHIERVQECQYIECYYIKYWNVIFQLK